MAGGQEDMDRGWWVVRVERTDEGGWDYQVQFADGSGKQFFIEPARDVDLVLAAAVDAYLRNDRRSLRKPERS